MIDRAKRRVAVVEDDPAVGDMIKKLLTLEGFDVVVFSDGVRASAGVRNSGCDAVILDVMLPGKDGIMILRELRGAATTQGLPVVMLSAKTDDKTTWEGWRAGANYYMSKPFDPEELIRVLRSAIG